MKNVKVYIRELIDEGIIAKEVSDQLIFLIKKIDMKNIKVYIQELIDEGIIAKEVADELIFLIKKIEK
jgi:hypothetical protein